jgi:hypothetical protein
MPFRRSRSNSRGGALRRPVDWEGGQFIGGLGANSIFCDWVIEPDFINQNLTDPTLMAIRWQGEFFHGTAPGIPSIAAAGLIAWNFVDPFFPPLECPDPILDADFDWVARFVIPQVGNGAAVLHAITADSLLMSQARRRLGNDKSILFVIATEVFPTDFVVDVRCLLKE